MWPDVINTLLGGTGLASVIGAAVMFYRTRQQGRTTEANVLGSLAGTATQFAESVRRDAQAVIEDVRRDAERQIESAVRRAERAEARTVTAERAAVEANISAMENAAAVRRMTNAILSPYASLEGLRAMVAPESGSNGVGVRV